LETLALPDRKAQPEHKVMLAQLVQQELPDLRVLLVQLDLLVPLALPVQPVQLVQLVLQV
jgi:hypothetical protein